MNTLRLIYILQGALNVYTPVTWSWPPTFGVDCKALWLPHSGSGTVKTASQNAEAALDCRCWNSSCSPRPSTRLIELHPWQKPQALRPSWGVTQHGVYLCSLAHGIFRQLKSSNTVAASIHVPMLLCWRQLRYQYHQNWLERCCIHDPDITSADIIDSSEHTATSIVAIATLCLSWAYMAKANLFVRTFRPSTRGHATRIMFHSRNVPQSHLQNPAYNAISIEPELTLHARGKFWEWHADGGENSKKRKQRVKYYAIHIELQPHATVVVIHCSSRKRRSVTARRWKAIAVALIERMWIVLSIMQGSDPKNYQDFPTLLRSQPKHLNGWHPTSTN